MSVPQYNLVRHQIDYIFGIFVIINSPNVTQLDPYTCPMSSSAPSPIPSCFLPFVLFSLYLSINALFPRRMPPLIFPCSAAHATTEDRTNMYKITKMLSNTQNTRRREKNLPKNEWQRMYDQHIAECYRNARNITINVETCAYVCSSVWFADLCEESYWIVSTAAWAVALRQLKWTNSVCWRACTLCEK